MCLVTWEELANKDEIADRFEGTGPGIDGNVRRGEQGKDMLMKIPYAYYLTALRGGAGSGRNATRPRP